MFLFKLFTKDRRRGEAFMLSWAFRLKHDARRCIKSIKVTPTDFVRSWKPTALRVFTFCVVFIYTTIITV